MSTYQPFRLTRGEPPFRWLWPFRTTAQQRQSLLRLIAVAAEERLPLAPLLEAWGRDERGVQHRRVRRLAQLLGSGTPLPEAVEQVRGALSDQDVLAIRYGSQSGTLALTIRDALDERRSQAAGLSHLLRTSVAYVATVAVIVGAIVTFLNLKINPSYQAIFDDFALYQPPMLQWTIGMGDVAKTYWPPLALLGLAVAWLAFSTRGRRVRNAVAGRMLRPYRQLQIADLLRKLGVAAQAGRPMAGSLSTLARYHFDAALRHKLLFVRNEVELGVDVWQSMTTAGLLAPAEANLLQTADRVGNRAWALRQIAAVKRGRTTRRLERFSRLLLPAAVLLLGAFVLSQALAYFTPLVTLIDALA